MEAGAFLEIKWHLYSYGTNTVSLAILAYCNPYNNVPFSFTWQ